MVDVYTDHVAPCQPSPFESCILRRYTNAPVAQEIEGTGVGTDVGTGVGTGVGKDVGEDVGTGVGTCDGADVGTEVGTDVGTLFLRYPGCYSGAILAL